MKKSVIAVKLIVFQRHTFPVLCPFGNIQILGGRHKHTHTLHTHTHTPVCTLVFVFSMINGLVEKKKKLLTSQGEHFAFPLQCCLTSSKFFSGQTTILLRSASQIDSVRATGSNFHPASLFWNYFLIHTDMIVSGLFSLISCFFLRNLSHSLGLLLKFYRKCYQPTKKIAFYFKMQRRIAIN